MNKYKITLECLEGETETLIELSPLVYREFLRVSKLLNLAAKEYAPTMRIEKID